MSGFQFDLLKSQEENAAAAKAHEEKSSLPASPLQYKLNNEDPTLTEREFTIMHMVLSGCSIEQIRMKIFLSDHGVKYRLSSIYHKFGVRNRLGLINKASTSGLQFRSESGVRHNFHTTINMREHEKVSNNEQSE